MESCSAGQPPPPAGEGSTDRLKSTLNVILRIPQSLLSIFKEGRLSSSLRRHCLLPAACCLLASLTGCGEYLNDHYGTRSGLGADSVNGTAVLADMFANEGHRVRSAASLYPRVGKADVIVWFQQDWEAPSPEAQSWLLDWLAYNEEGEGKTLIYVSRDYSAAEYYWATAKPMAPAAQHKEYDKRIREAARDFTTRRGMGAMGGEVDDWFELDRRNPKTTVKKLTGPWAKGVDAGKAAIEHRRYLTPKTDAHTLLADGQGHPLVSELIYEPEEWEWRTEDSRVVLFENSSLLLNASLVNKEHRKLAGRLVDYAGPPKLDVVFLEARSSVTVLDSDPSASPPSGLTLFTIWPIGATLAQLAALGLVFAAARWPIFGTPRRSERASLTDFGRHVKALGRLLAATGDRAYAEGQLRAYFQQKDDSK